MTAAGKVRPGRPVAAWRAPAVMRRVRLLHLYLGVLFAPAILFFAFTGILQVYGLSAYQVGYRPPVALSHLAALHKDQTFVVRSFADLQKAAKAAPGAAGPKTAAPAKVAPKPMSMGRVLLKAFSAAAALCLITATLLGLFMAYVLGRDTRMILGLLAAGVLIPVVLIFGLGA